MIYRSGENKQIDIIKTKIGLRGSVYVVGDVIQSFESHKKMFKNSRASNITEAQEEYLEYLEEQLEKLKEGESSDEVQE